MPIFEPKEPISQDEMKRQQQQLEAKLNRKAASEMVEFISPGADPAMTSHNIERLSRRKQYHRSTAFEGGDLWEEDDIRRAEAKAFARECIQKARDKFRSFRTKAANRILRRVPFGESIKSALRRWA